MMHANQIHNMTGTRTYRIWAAMKARCQRKTSSDYPKYGGRGIKVCARWQKFENFLADMGEAPPELSIERNDNDGNYDISNCCWASTLEQARNKTTNHKITHNGKTACLSEWEEITGISQKAILRRLSLGWSVSDALSLPVTGCHVSKLIEYRGERLGLVEWAKKLGISKNGLHSRLSRGWSLERALTK